MKTLNLIAMVMAFLVSAHVSQGQVLRKKEQVEDSLIKLLETELSDQDRAKSLFELGRYYQYLDSAKSLKTLKELEPLAINLGDNKMLANMFHLKAGIFRKSSTSQLSLKYYMKSLERNEQAGDSLWVAMITAEIGRLYSHFLNDRDTSNYLINEALKYFEKYDDTPRRIAWCLDIIADNHRNADNYFKALETYQKVYDLYQDTNDTTNMAKKLANMANIHFVMDEYPKAIDMYKKSIRLLTSVEPDVNTNLWLKSNNLNIGLALINQEMHAEAYPYLRLADSLKNHARGTRNSILIHAIGLYHFKTGQIDSAMNRYQQALAMATKNKNNYALPKILRGVATVYEKRGRYDSAVEFAQQSVDVAIASDQPDHYSEGVKLLANLYEKKGNYKKALEHYTDFHEVSDSLLNENKIREITTLENRHVFENEKKVLAQQQREKELVLQAEIQRQNFIQYALYAGLGTLALLAFVFYRFYTSKKNDNLQINRQRDELQRNNEQLTQLSSFKQGLTQMIAHDMKNPLSVIIALADRQKNEESWQEVGQSGKLMLQMVHNMLDVERFEETQMNLKQTSQNLSDLAVQAKYQVELLMMAKSVKFENKVPEHLFAMADPEIIIRIFVNLYTNAIKYMKVGGRISVDAQKIDGRIQISVADTGKGIEEDLIGHIFEKFWQSDPKKLGMSTSNGLGLTFCKMAVMAHGGDIKVQSKVDEGSTFSFDLPEGTPDQDSPKSTKITFEDESNLSSEEIELIRQLSKKLRQIPIYKSSKIEEVLRELDHEDSVAVKLWKQKLKEASFSFDNEAFDSLTDY